MKKFSFKKLSRKQKILLIVGLLILAGAIAWFAVRWFRDEAEPELPPEPTYSQLMGIEVEPEVAERPVLGIMVENSPFARPQTGVGSAGIVFESVTEGGITRYLTLFQENIPEEVGPVRSVRPYFVNWLMGFDASVAHVGGSAEALALIKQRDAKSLTQFAYPEPYYRSADREAPHNMYVKTAGLIDLQEQLEHETANFDEIPRSDDNPAMEPNATRIGINYSGSDYAVEFRYHKESNSYKRFLAGKADTDAATDKQISVKNLVVLKMKSSTVDAIGNGEALIYKDGTFKKATWKQTSFRERIVLTDAEGNEVPLNRGSTWFAVIPSTGSASHR